MMGHFEYFLSLESGGNTSPIACQKKKKKGKTWTVLELSSPGAIMPTSDPLKVLRLLP